MGLAVPAAYAETPADRADAETLASAAAALVERGDYLQACTKYEASARLDPGARRFMKLAECQERAGLPARAWMAFGDALDWAQSRGDKALAVSARDNAKRLEAKLGRIEIVVPPNNEIEGLQIRRDGALVAEAVRGVPVPVDPGLHVVSATAPGRSAWSTTIGLSPGKTTVSVVVPFLDELRETAAPVRTPSSSAPPSDGDTGPLRARAPLAPALAPAADSDVDLHRGSTQRTVGWVLGATGLAGLAVGTVFAFQAISSRSSLNGTCAGPATCPTSMRDEIDAMHAQGTAANVLFWGGLASLAGGAIVYFTAPSPKRTEQSAASLQVVPSLAPGAASVFATGRF
ncbi:MAG TPA: hypothetical protein VK550_02570 [Polyangiaceae bacterium]|nr:hypothetical protein [Polyangiaceae bacterium]